MDKFKVVIVIPAFNEEDTIFNVVKSVKEYGVVIVVNDASTDNTEQIAIDAGAILVNHKENKGYDGALNSGFVKAEELNCNAIITFDADGQHSPESIKEYIDLLEQGLVVVTGIRNKFQRVSEYIFSWVAKWRWGIFDPLCGMKAYHVDLYKELGCFDSYKSIGTELIIFAATMGREIAQIPIQTKNRIDVPRFGSVFSTNILILSALWSGYKKYGR
mgnify:CR=1 FL=1|jgi:glycosyltransferase involved in cell wall biosynthesis